MDMIQKIADKAFLLSKADLLKKKKFKPGVDGMTADAAKIWLEINGERLCRDLLKERYSPMPATGLRIAEKDGGFGRLSHLTALDTILQYAILDQLEPVCEAKFSPSSFAYRPGRGITAAVNQYCALASAHKWAARIDVISCFDHLDHAVLKTALQEFVPDARLRRLVEKYISVSVMEDDELISLDEGVLQDVPISPLLCNIYLSKLDACLDQQGIPFVRYADDSVLFADSLEEITRSERMASDVLTQELHLQKNGRKCGVDTPVNLQYLGYKFHMDRHGMVALQADTSAQNAYLTWHTAKPVDNRRRVDILSDGILRQKDYSLLFESDAGASDIPIAQTDVINIYSSVIFDTGFLQKALDSGIEIHVFSKENKCVGTFTPSAALRSPRTTMEQLTAYYDKERRLALAKLFVLSAIHNTRLNIRYYNKYAPSELYERTLTKLSRVVAQINDCTDYEKLLLLDAKFKELYYGCFDTILREGEFSFERRTRRPPENEVNAMISFGDTVLYNLIATEIYKTPLDIRVGCLHATNRRMESLNLDIADVFKPLIVDRTVFALVNRRAIRSEHFDTQDNGGVYLNTQGVRVFLEAFYDKLETVLTNKDEKMSYIRIIREETQKLLRYMRTGEKYVPFRQVR